MGLARLFPGNLYNDGLVRIFVLVARFVSSGIRAASYSNVTQTSESNTSSGEKRVKRTKTEGLTGKLNEITHNSF